MSALSKRYRTERVAVAAWLLAAQGCSLVFVARAMAPAYQSDGLVQDDARNHIFWMARFRDPEMFPNDLIADYWQAVAPPGYSALYWALSWFVEPLTASKLLPPLLGIVTAVFTFLLARALYPVPAAAFVASALLSWYVWQYDDLVSATSRAFLLPLLAALLWALVQRRTSVAVALVVLLALFYPAGGALGLGLLGAQLLRFRGWRPLLERRRQPWAAFLIAALLVGLVILHGQLATSKFGPIVLADEAQSMPEFGPNGRVPYFVDDPYRYWLKSNNSGLDLLASDRLLLDIPILFEYAALAALLPLLLVFRRSLPTTARLSDQSVILLQLLATSAALFFLAHMLLFRLWLPSRYVKWSLPLVFSVAAAITLTILVEELAARLAPQRRGVLVASLALALAVALAAYPVRYDNAFVFDRHPTITAYLRDEPKDIVVAGVPSETDSVPSFAGRTILTNRENAYPVHLGYYRQLRQRTEDLIDAYYAESSEAIVAFAAQYNVDVFLVNRHAFQSATFAEVWRNFSSGRWQPFHSAVAAKLQGSRRFALLEAARRCGTVSEGALTVVPTACLL
jgi:hypothetical protein